MEVRLSQPEIEAAVRLYLTEEEGIRLEGRKLEIEFLSGRNPPTVSADIKISRAEKATDHDEVSLKEEAADPAEPATAKPFSDEQQEIPFLGGNS